jgi:hypothetical protein
MRVFHRRGHVPARVLAVLLAAAAGCGYGFRELAAHIPSGAETIRVGPFENKTEHVGVELVLAAAFEDVIRERGMFRIVSSGAADLALSGRIRGLNFTQSAAVNSLDQAVIYSSALVLEARLADRGGKTLWRQERLEETRAVAVDPRVVIPSSPRFQQGTLNADDVERLTAISSIQLAEYRLSGEVLRDLADAMARTVYAQMMEGF